MDVRTVIVPSEAEGMKTGLFLRRILPDLPESIIRKVFDYEVDYGELVSELYVYLMEDDAVKLRNFEYRSSVYQWIMY